MGLNSKHLEYFGKLLGYDSSRSNYAQLTHLHEAQTGQRGGLDMRYGYGVVENKLKGSRLGPS